MAFDGTVIRVRSSIGISRLCLPKEATLGDLKTELLKRINISDDVSVRLYIEGTNKEVCGSDDTLLSSLGILHGATLRLEQLFGSESSIQYAGLANSANVSHNESPENDIKVKRESNDPKFKSFDAHLFDNGYSTGELPLRQSYKPLVLKKGCINKLPLGVTIKHQVYRHVDHIEIMNVNEIHNFVNYWMSDLSMNEQRVGWLYGYYTEDHHYPMGIRAVCEAIYEPPQESSLCEVCFLDDPFLPTVDSIAEKLGLERIGHIFTHLPRETYLSPQDVVDSAKIQLARTTDIHYTGYPISTHVTCTMHPDDEGKPCLNAFMVSDSAMALLRDGIISDVQSDHKMITVRPPRDSCEILPQIFESGKEVSSLDSSWFLVRVNDSAPIKSVSFFKHNHFPRENRNTKLGPSHVQKYFMNPDITSEKGSTNPMDYNDFHLLLYIAKALDTDTALVICDAIVNNAAIDTVLWDLLVPQ